MKKSSRSLTAVVLTVILVLSMTAVAVFTAVAEDKVVDNSAIGEVTTTIDDVVQQTDPEETSKEAEPAKTVGKLGDLTGDGAVNSSDARAVLRIVAKIDKTDALKNVLSDVNGDGKVQSYDARAILRHTARIEILTSLLRNVVEVTADGSVSYEVVK